MDRAVAVGINAYPYPNALRGCLNDVSDIKAAAVSLCGFDPAGFTVLQDDRATATAIKNTLREVVALLKPGDRFLFWYSGHGAQLVEGNAATDVICPVDFDFTLETSVGVQEFHDIFSKIPPGVTAVWGSDSCHSGDLERDFYSHGVPKKFRRVSSTRDVVATATVRTFRDVAAVLPNIALISGCRSDQTSADAFIENRYNGAMTYFLLRTLKAGDGVTIPLTAFVPRVLTALAAAGYVQCPQLSGPQSEVSRAFLQSHQSPAAVGSTSKLQAGWSGLPADFALGFDAAINGAGPYAGKCYIFKGDSYIRYDWERDAVDPGYPKKIAAGWPSLPSDFRANVDALVNGRGPRAGKCFLFKGNACVRYDWEQDGADPGYPRPIADEWHGLPDGFGRDLNAALEGAGALSGAACLFKQTRSFATIGQVTRRYPDRAAPEPNRLSGASIRMVGFTALMRCSRASARIVTNTEPHPTVDDRSGKRPWFRRWFV